jgi:type VI secretion system protein VasD
MLPSFNKNSPSLSHHVRWLPLSLLFVVALSGCGMMSKSPKPLSLPITAPPVSPSADAVRPPEEFAVKGVADERVNLDVTDRPLSVVVRVYQLRTTNEFSRLNFEALAGGRNDATLFQKDLVTVSEFVLVPGTTQELEDKLLPETKYVGVVGFFRRPEPQYWRFLVDARSVRNEGLIFRATQCYLTSITPRAELLPGQTLGGKPDCYGTSTTPIRAAPPRSKSR